MAATASDDASVTKVEFRVDGTLVGTDTTAPYRLTWIANKKTSYASHTVAVRAYDAQGLTASQSVTVKRTRTASRCAYAATAAKRRAARRASGRR